MTVPIDYLLKLAGDIVEDELRNADEVVFWFETKVAIEG